MAEDIQNSGEQAPAGGQQTVQVRVDERDLKMVYANAYTIHTAAEEVVIDMGFHMPRQNQQTGQTELHFKVTDRLVVSYANAKRLAMSLGQLIKRYEQQFGELPLAPGQRR